MNPARLREPDGDPQYRVAVEFDVFADNLIDARETLEDVTRALGGVTGLHDVRLYAEFVKDDDPRVTIKQIAERVAESFGVTLDDLYGETRRTPLPLARHVVMYVARSQGMTTGEVGAALGRDRSTVSWAVGDIERIIGSNSLGRAQIERAIRAAGAAVVATGA